MGGALRSRCCWAAGRTTTWSSSFCRAGALGVAFWDSPALRPRPAGVPGAGQECTLGIFGAPRGARPPRPPPFPPPPGLPHKTPPQPPQGPLGPTAPQPSPHPRTPVVECSYLVDAHAAGAAPTLRSVPSSRSEVFKDRQLSPVQVKTRQGPRAAGGAAKATCAALREAQTVWGIQPGPACASHRAEAQPHALSEGCRRGPGGRGTPEGKLRRVGVASTTASQVLFCCADGCVDGKQEHPSRGAAAPGGFGTRQLTAFSVAGLCASQ